MCCDCPLLAANVRGKGSPRLAGPTAKDQRPPRARLRAVQLDEEEEIPAVGGGVHRRGGISATSERDDRQGHNEAGKHGPHRTRCRKNNCCAVGKVEDTSGSHVRTFYGKPQPQMRGYTTRLRQHLDLHFYYQARERQGEGLRDRAQRERALTCQSGGRMRSAMISNSGGNPQTRTDEAS